MINVGGNYFELVKFKKKFFVVDEYGRRIYSTYLVPSWKRAIFQQYFGHEMVYIFWHILQKIPVKIYRPKQKTIKKGE